MPDQSEMLRAEWAKFTAADPDTWDDFDFTDKELAFAYELACEFQANPPTMLQVSYFVEDAEAVASRIPDAPWTIRKTHMPGERYDWLILVNGVVLGLEDGEDMGLDVIGKLPAEWDRENRAIGWDEGFDAGEKDAWDVGTEDHVCTPNPYRGDNR